MGSFKAKLNSRDDLAVDILGLDTAVTPPREFIWMTVHLDFFAETLNDKATFERLENGEEIEFSISEVTRE